MEQRINQVDDFCVHKMMSPGRKLNCTILGKKEPGVTKVQEQVRRGVSRVSVWLITEAEQAKDDIIKQVAEVPGGAQLITLIPMRYL